jgi:hypothetical protein
MAGAVPELASGVVGSTHHLWVARTAWGWLLWVAWQTGLLYNQNDIEVRPGLFFCICPRMLCLRQGNSTHTVPSDVLQTASRWLSVPPPLSPNICCRALWTLASLSSVRADVLVQQGVFPLS